MEWENNEPSNEELEEVKEVQHSHTCQNCEREYDCFCDCPDFRFRLCDACAEEDEDDLETV